MKTVTMGPPAPALRTLQQRLGSDVNDYFPHTVSIRVGDRVRFVPNGFHTVHLPARGGGILPIFVSTTPISGANDAAGNPYWFNGQTNFGFNPALTRSQFGRTVSFNGRRRVESGVPAGRRPRPFTVRFTRTGRYTYLCDIHPGMRGVVRVVSRRGRVPSARTDARAVRRQVNRAISIARALRRATPPAGVVYDGVAGRFGVEYFQFVPQTITVPRGTTLTFRMTRGSYEAHTATAGPGDPEREPNSFLGRMVASLETPTVDPALIYPSDPPGTPAALTPTSHGNGFWNSGVLDTDNASPPPPANAVTFAQPGTYTFYCLIHPFMKATVTVT